MNFLAEDLIADPYPIYARWQAQSPIFRAEDTGQWVLTRHDDVRSVLKSSGCAAAATATTSCTKSRSTPSHCR